MNDNRPLGLAYCSFSSTEGADEITFCSLYICLYCRKAAELVISAIFVSLCGYEMYKQVKAYGWKMQWRFFAIVFMATSLISTDIK